VRDAEAVSDDARRVLKSGKSGRSSGRVRARERSGRRADDETGPDGADNGESKLHGPPPHARRSAAPGLHEPTFPQPSPKHKTRVRRADLRAASCLTHRNPGGETRASINDRKQTTMTSPDDRSALWVLDELWGAPAEVVGTLTDEENLEYGKAPFCAANGDGRITDAERDWIVGYARAVGHSAENVDALRAYDGATDFEDLFTRGKQRIAQRACICDAIRACGADGELAPEELATVHRMADRLDIPGEVVDEFVDIYRQEQELKARRIALTFPDGFGQ
jgi:hypothetical protein